MKKDSNIIELKPILVKHATIRIEGDGDLVLNKMSARNERQLLADDRKKVKEQPNVWEDLLTAIHWRDPLPFKDTYTEVGENEFMSQLKNNAPCISAFGLKKSWCQAVVRNEIDKYSTKFDSALNIIAGWNLVPITFETWSVDERLMSPKRGAPITVRLNHFGGWKADVDILYTDSVYSISEIVNVINLAGFSLGIGSGRSSGYGRYHVIDVK